MKTIKKIIGILLAVMMAAQLTVMFAAAEDDTAGTYNGYSYERLLDYAIIYEYSGEAKGEIVLPEYVDGLKVLGVSVRYLQSVPISPHITAIRFIKNVAV